MCSIATMYRILRAVNEVGDRRRQRTHPATKKPELCARRPLEVWSWDITKLRTNTRGKYFELYVIIDIYSRFVVGWTVAEHESGRHAKNFIARTYRQQGVKPGELTLHSDRGASMTSKTVAQLLVDLGVDRSHNRPHTSNDNPYSEAAFKTLKYCPAFPERFDSIHHARRFCTKFFEYYNHQHYHSGIALLTPATVHQGCVRDVDPVSWTPDYAGNRVGRRAVWPVQQSIRSSSVVTRWNWSSPRVERSPRSPDRYRLTRARCGTGCATPETKRSATSILVV
jgi:putative transposase